MRRFILSLVGITMVALAVNAQQEKSNKFKLSIAGDAGITLGDYSLFSILSYGGDLQAEYNVAPKYAVTFSAGFTAMSGRFGITGLPELVPLLLGGRYYVTRKIYGSAQVGTSFILRPGFSSSELGKGSAFTFVPGVGYKFSKHFDLLFKYQSAIKNNINFSFTGLRIAYTF
jgi:hypothetical protein